MKTRNLCIISMLAWLLGLVGCGGGGGTSPNGGAGGAGGGTTSLTGVLRGPLGARVVLQNNGGDDIAVNVIRSLSGTGLYDETAFTFPTKLANGATYQITGTVAPTEQTCSIYLGASGSMPVAANAVKVGCEYTLDLISRSSTDAVLGTATNSSVPVIGGDAVTGEGRFVAFVSYAPGMGGASGANYQVFWRDRMSGQTLLVSANASGVEGNYGSFAPAISADGQTVVFESYASNLVTGDTNGVRDVFLWSAQNPSGGVQRVSVSGAGGQANGESWGATVSANGKVVAFATAATNLTSGGSHVTAGNVVLRDLITGNNTLVSADANGVGLGGDRPALSEDGSRLAFWSYSSQLVAGDANGLWDIFVYDRTSNTLSRVSLTSTGGERNQGSESVSRIVSPAISGNGRYVAFATTATNMVPGDSNGAQDVFVVDTQTHSVVRASVDSAGVQGNADSPTGQGERVALSYDGTWVAFTTNATNLGAPTNGNNNVAMHNITTGQTLSQPGATLGVSGPASMSRSAGYVVFGGADTLDPRFFSSGLFARFTGAVSAWWWN